MERSKMAATRIWAPALVVLSLLAGCARQETTDSTVEPAADKPALNDADWEAELSSHRAEIDEDYKTSRTSPMAGTQYLKSEAGERFYLDRADRTFELATSAAASTELLVEKREDSWHWEAMGDGITCESDGEEIPAGTAIEGSALFSIAGLDVRLYPSDDQVTFIVFDPERPQIQTFEHLLYFPADRTFAVQARVVELPEPEPLEMPTTRGLIKTFYRHATIEFDVDGKGQELTAFKYALEGDAAKGLFIPFKDTTTGQETYGAGRYIQIDDPESDDFVLDFNRAFNPLCNYSPAYNCTLPPHENHLKVAIRAGEKAYPDLEGAH